MQMCDQHVERLTAGVLQFVESYMIKWLNSMLCKWMIDTLHNRRRFRHGGNLILCTQLNANCRLCPDEQIGANQLPSILQKQLSSNCWFEVLLKIIITQVEWQTTSILTIMISLMVAQAKKLPPAEGNISSTHRMKASLASPKVKLNLWFPRTNISILASEQAKNQCNAVGIYVIYYHNYRAIKRS